MLRDSIWLRFKRTADQPVHFPLCGLTASIPMSEFERSSRAAQVDGPLMVLFILAIFLASIAAETHDRLYRRRYPAAPHHRLEFGIVYFFAAWPFCLALRAMKPGATLGDVLAIPFIFTLIASVPIWFIFFPRKDDIAPPQIGSSYLIHDGGHSKWPLHTN